MNHEQQAARTPDELTSNLLATLHRHAPMVTREEVEHFAPLLLMCLSRADPTLELPPVAMDVLSRFVVKANIDGDASGQEIASSIARYYDANPVTDRVRAGFERMLRELSPKEMIQGGTMARKKLRKRHRD